MPEIHLIAPRRGTDAHGEGHFGASRGARRHRGEDFAAYPNSTLLSPVPGVVSKLGWPYASDDPKRGWLRYVEITTKSGHRHRFFYVLPTVVPNDQILVNTPIGIVQNLQVAFDQKMTPHVHYEIITPEGEFIPPLGP